MLRRGFFGSLLAAMGLGAQIPDSERSRGVTAWNYMLRDASSRDVVGTDLSGNAFLGKTKPKPNQCPVCGAMAEPYKRSSTHGAILEVQLGANEVIDERVGEFHTGSMERIIRCKRCNAAFWQDAVE